MAVTLVFWAGEIHGQRTLVGQGVAADVDMIPSK